MYFNCTSISCLFIKTIMFLFHLLLDPAANAVHLSLGGSKNVKKSAAPVFQSDVHDNGTEQKV